MKNIKRITELVKGSLENVINDLEDKNPRAMQSLENLNKEEVLSDLREELSNTTLNLKLKTALKDGLESKITELTEAVTFAKSEAEALLLRTEAKEQEYLVEAEGQKKLNEAANTLTDAQRNFLKQQKLIEILPELVGKSAENLANIDSIKVVDMTGMNTTKKGDQSTGNVSMADQVVNAAAKHQVQKPLIDNLLAEVGLNTEKSVQEGVSAMVSSNLMNS